MMEACAFRTRHPVRSKTAMLLSRYESPGRVAVVTFDVRGAETAVVSIAVCDTRVKFGRKFFDALTP
jgi:hypothetical protein